MTKARKWRHNNRFHPTRFAPSALAFPRVLRTLGAGEAGR
jgi:hypothetical protein